MLLNYSDQLDNKSSPEFIQLSDKVSKELYKVFRPLYPNTLIRVIINKFTKGSVIAETKLEFTSNATTADAPQSADAVRILYNSINSSGYVGVLPVDRLSIQSDTVTIQQLPLSTTSVAFQTQVGFISDLYSNSSVAYQQLENKTLVWLLSILKPYYGDPVQLALNFSNNSNWVSTSVKLQFNTTVFVSSTVLINNILQSSSPVPLVKYTLTVNAMPAVPLAYNIFTYNLRILNKQFSSDMSNRSSAAFAELSTQLKQALLTLFQIKNGFTDLYVTDMKMGSVITSTTFMYKPDTTTSSDVTNTLLSGISQVNLQGIQLDPWSIVGSATPVPPAQTPFPGYAIAIIVLCSLLIILIPVVLVVALKTRLFKKLARACSLRSPDSFDLRARLYEAF
ncbi:uncharacterized protein LOC120541282 [Polypterus senegalus]|uniref:uncharacterized protein LOC120541282 n=1 Tax=Polypterus senegalus TaxID=55291 RepID=UPI0019646E99|nr:uncharacterized protein LOC120541282 [Polypterus senegalus]